MNRIARMVVGVALPAALLACEQRVDPCARGGIVTPSVVAASVNALSTPPLMIVVSPVEVTLAVGGRDTVWAVAAGLGDPRCGSLPRTIDWSIQDTTVARMETVTLPDSDLRAATVVVGRVPGTTALIATLHAELTVRVAALVHVTAAP